MKITVKQLRSVIRDVLQEGQWGSPTGKLRSTKNMRSAGGRQVKAGRVEEQNKQLSPTEVESMFPGAIEAWIDVVPDIFPELPAFQTFKDDPNPRALVDGIKNNTVWTKVGQSLKASFPEIPGVDLATWDPTKQDWVEEANPIADTTRGW